MRHCVYISSLHHHVGAITLTLKRSSCIAIPRNSQTFRTAAMSTVSQSSTKIVKCASLMPGFLRWVDHCNNADRLLTPGQSSTPSFTPFQIQDETVGYIDHKFVQQLKSFPDTFEVTPTTVLLAPSLRTADLSTRSHSVASAMSALRDAGVITGWRNELYPVLSSFYHDPVLLLERAAAPFFGIKAYGVHVNGYVRQRHDGQILLWVARRSASKPTWPGKLDHIVAGGQPHGLSLAENVVKECEEEAGIPSTLASQAVPVGVVTYTALQPVGLKRDVLFCYDLELPEDFVPVAQDGEVQDFFLMSLPEVAAMVAGGTPDEGDLESYKDNCNLVVLDFLVRHGAIPPDTPGYLELARKLRAGDCS